MQPDLLIPISEVCTMTGISRATIYRRINEGSFPRPRQVGPRSVRWLLSEVQGWIISRPLNCPRYYRALVGDAVR